MSTVPPDLQDLVDRLASALRAGDVPAAAALCDDDPSLTVYDVDGHQYRGARHWARRPAGPQVTQRVEDIPAEITLHEPVALVTWTGAQVARTTALVIRRPAGWRVTHLHHSPATPGPRPGDI